MGINDRAHLGRRVRFRPYFIAGFRRKGQDYRILPCYTQHTLRNAGTSPGYRTDGCREAEPRNGSGHLGRSEFSAPGGPVPRQGLYERARGGRLLRPAGGFRTTHISEAEASAASVFSAALHIGCQRFSYRTDFVPTACATVSSFPARRSLLICRKYHRSYWGSCGRRKNQVGGKLPQPDAPAFPDFRSRNGNTAGLISRIASSASISAR